MVETCSARHPILLVEDDQDIRESVAELLQDEGYQVVQAHHGQEGFELLKTMQRPCLILLDMMMPVLDGHGFMQLLQASEALIAIPVVVISAGQAGLPGGVKGFIRKPFHLDALVAVVKEHCG